jgi:hypothetical protein
MQVDFCSTGPFCSITSLAEYRKAVVPRRTYLEDDSFHRRVVSPGARRDSFPGGSIVGVLDAVFADPPIGTCGVGPGGITEAGHCNGGAVIDCE